MNSSSLKNPIGMSSPALHKAASVWHWWTGELTGLLPGPLRAALLPRVERLYLKAEAQAIMASTSGPEFGEDSERYPMPGEEMDAKQARSLEKLIERSREIIVLLPASKALIKPMKLPLVAASNLREVLGFEMDRQTPFSLNQVYYDYLLTGRDHKNALLNVDLLVTPRKHIDQLLAALKKTGIFPHRIGILDTNGEHSSAINLLPESERPEKRNSARHLNLALAFIAVCLLATSVSLPLFKQQQRIDALETEVELKKRKAAVIQRLAGEIEQLESTAGFLPQKKQATPLTLEIINELTRILPDNTWINSLSIKGKEVQIQGFSKASSELIPLIDASQRFQNPRFRSSVTTSQNSEEERFHLSMEISTEDAL